MCDIEAVNIDLIMINEMLKHHDGAMLMMSQRGIRGYTSETWQEVMIEQMRKRTMTQVMTEPCELDEHV